MATAVADDEEEMTTDEILEAFRRKRDRDPDGDPSHDPADDPDPPRLSRKSGAGGAAPAKKRPSKAPGGTDEADEEAPAKDGPKPSGKTPKKAPGKTSGKPQGSSDAGPSGPTRPTDPGEARSGSRPSDTAASEGRTPEPTAAESPAASSASSAASSPTSSSTSSPAPATSPEAGDEDGRSTAWAATAWAATLPVLRGPAVLETIPVLERIPLLEALRDRLVWVQGASGALALVLALSWGALATWGGPLAAGGSIALLAVAVAAAAAWGLAIARAPMAQAALEAARREAKALDGPPTVEALPVLATLRAIDRLLGALPDSAVQGFFGTPDADAYLELLEELERLAAQGD